MQMRCMISYMYGILEAASSAKLNSTRAEGGGHGRGAGRATEEGLSHT